MIHKKVEPKEFEQMVADCVLYPKRGRYIVLEDGFTYTGKLVIPDTAKRRPTSGLIIKCGPDCDASWLGERVVYGSFSGTAIQIQNQPRYRSLSEEEVLCSVVVPEGHDFVLEDVSA